ncbi:MAG: hypothetical protein AAF799_42675 [Myxococcota bacterium]
MARLSRTRWLAGLGVVVLVACASKTDERVRQAWGGASENPDDVVGGPTRDREVNEDGTPRTPTLYGWDRVDEILDVAIAEVSLGTDDEVLARLAKRWCNVEPVAKDVEKNLVWVCIPKPQVLIEGHSFTLELSGEGVIGLVAAELSADESTRLAAEARERTERWCAQTWTPSPRPSPEQAPLAETAPQIDTCVVEGSALLSVARYLEGEGPSWRVSMAVIDAS